MRDPDYEEEGEALDEEEEDSEEESSPKKKPVKKKPLIKKKEDPTPQQTAVMRIPVFESQAMQVFYDELLAIHQRVDQVATDIAEIKTDIAEIKKLAQD